MLKISICQICSIKFSPGSGSKGIVCSRLCANKLHSIRQTAKQKILKERKLESNPHYCKNCDKLLTKKWQLKFCCASCSTTWNNGRRIYTKPNRPNCLICGNKTSKATSKYCSNKCRRVDSGIVKPIKKKDPNKPFNCTCKHCGAKFQSPRCKHYCDDCVEHYSHAGRARYWFSINVYKYPELFDLEALNKIGFRSNDNPNGYTRDHKVSVNHAIKNGYDPYYIAHVMNCELMLWAENNKKKTKSSISYEELVKLVDEYDSTKK